LNTAAGVTVSTYSAATSANLSISGSTLTINPTADLGYSTGYSVEFAAGTIKDLAGNSYAGTTSYNFTSGSRSNTLPTGSVTISGTPTQGQTLTVTNTLADLDGLGTISYQWSAGGLAISGATSSTYVLTQAEVGKAVTVIASYTDALSTAESKTSSATEAVVSIDTLAPTVTTFSPADEATGVGLSSNIVLTFGESVVARSGGTIELMTDYGSGHQSVEVFSVSDATLVTISGNVVTIDHTSALLPSTGYHLGFNSALADTAGNAFSCTHGQYNFITAAANTAGKTADITAYSWKAHTLLSNVSLNAASTNLASDSNGTASFTAVTDTTLSLTASRAIPSAEATATSAAVNLQDAIAILKMIVGLEVNGTGKALSPYQALAADYDGNGLVQLTDAIGVLKHVVGLTAPDPAWRFVNELDATVPSKTTLSPGVAQTSITASLSASSPVKVGLVGYLSGDVDGSFAGAAGSSSLTKTYFDTLVAAHPTELSLAQFGVY
jgi:hypothetical protein